jgi:hypothetical protein
MRLSEKGRNSKKTFVFEQISGIIFLKIDFSDTLVRIYVRIYKGL